MSRMEICMKVFGLATDSKTGEKDYAGMKVDLGEYKPGREVPYDELISKIDKVGLLSMLGLDSINPEDVEFITPDEYYRDYDDEDDEDADT